MSLAARDERNLSCHEGYVASINQQEDMNSHHLKGFLHWQLNIYSQHQNFENKK